MGGLWDDHLKGGDDFRGGVGDSVLDFTDALLGVGIPEPHIVKSFDLGVDVQPGASEDRGILCVGIEGRIEADQVNASVREVCHDVEAVAIVEGVGGKADVHSRAAPVG